jgi:hypothetical protein
MTQHDRRRSAGIQAAAVVLLLAIAAGCRAPEPLPTGAERFLRLGSDGQPLAPVATGPHACVLDRVTGLTWVVNQPVDQSPTYTWFSSDPAVHVSDPGVRAGGRCALPECDTAALVAATNVAARCGHADWRLPGREEALTLSARAPAGNPHVLDPEFFPDTVAGEYWTGETFRLYPQSAWAFDTRTGLDRTDWKKNAKPVRLVRGVFDRASLKRHAR